MTAKEYKKWNKKYDKEFDDILCLGMGAVRFSKDYPDEFFQLKKKEQDALNAEYMKFLERYFKK